MLPPFTPRPSQSEILRYRGGRLGIAAVPGAGKTHILSRLAADIILREHLRDDQEVLIVTLVNSAVDNFDLRIKKFFDNPLQALYKYRVRTLHGLAHDIVREKPARVGLEDRFAIIDDREAEFIRREAVTAWLSANPGALDDYLDPQLEESKKDWVRREPLPGMAASLALAFIRSAKDRQLTPEELRLQLDRIHLPLPLAEMGLAIYTDYQRALAYRAAVDFDDLIRLAADLLEQDDDYLDRLRYRFPFILEDEAQDSSRLQEAILGMLSSPVGTRGSILIDGPRHSRRDGKISREGNWVRVGDPNQAIFETFTTASPELLRAFIREYPHLDMPESGRSQPGIIDLANRLIDWVMDEHPVVEARRALSPPFIRPSPPGDPQPNPPTDWSAVRLVSRRLSPEEEVTAVVESLSRWLPSHRDSTVAVLVPRNARGVELIEALKRRGVDYLEFLASTSSTRATAGALSHLIAYLADPQSAVKLARAYQVWRRDWREQAPPSASEPGEEPPQIDAKADSARRSLMGAVGTLLRKLNAVESFIAPNPENDWLSALGEPQQVFDELAAFRAHVSRWLEAVTLPIDQLVLTLAQDVFTSAADLALSQKLASVLRTAAQDHPDWRLPELTAELAVIARNERRFIGFSVEDTGFDPDRHRGRVVVTTMHKAKGLEWDRVYLMSVNNYDFPSNQPNDRYIAEKWFIRDRLNLEAEALAQLDQAVADIPYPAYTEGAPTLASRLDYVRERLRLLYVGVTRARRELIVTWNTGRQGEATPALALSALMGWMEQIKDQDAP